MDESILNDIKKYIGIDTTYTVFDDVLVSHINTIIFILRQLGIGPTNGFTVTGPDETWEEYIPGFAKIPAVRTYIQIRVKMLFENLTNSALIESLNQSMNELAWRLNVEVDT